MDLLINDVRVVSGGSIRDIGAYLKAEVTRVTKEKDREIEEWKARATNVESLVAEMKSLREELGQLRERIG